MGLTDEDIERIWPGMDAEFVKGMTDGRNLDCPWPSSNRHPAYRHSFEIWRMEASGKPVPASLSRKRAQHIESGGDFYEILTPTPAGDQSPVTERK